VGRNYLELIVWIVWIVWIVLIVWILLFFEKKKRKIEAGKSLS
jgi:hypothetical protein